MSTDPEVLPTLLSAPATILVVNYYCRSFVFPDTADGKRRAEEEYEDYRQRLMKRSPKDTRRALQLTRVRVEDDHRTTIKSLRDEYSCTHDKRPRKNRIYEYLFPECEIVCVWWWKAYPNRRFEERNCCL